MAKEGPKLQEIHYRQSGAPTYKQCILLGSISYNRHASVLHVFGNNAFTFMLDMVNISDIKEICPVVD